MPTTKKKQVRKKSCYRVTAITRVKGNFQWEIDVEAHSKTEAIELAQKKWSGSAHLFRLNAGNIPGIQFFNWTKTYATIGRWPNIKWVSLIDR